MDYLQQAIDQFGTAAALARQLGVKPMLISHWKNRGVPPNRCKAIEKATGGKVRATDLRPDIFGGRAR
jgi:DNA-binding transcriptional regulator YdaS (Cro superfamily)